MRWWFIASVVVFLLMLTNRSDPATILGRYSLRFALLLFVMAGFVFISGGLLWLERRGHLPTLYLPLPNSVPFNVAVSAGGVLLLGGFWYFRPGSSNFANEVFHVYVLALLFAALMIVLRLNGVVGRSLPQDWQWVTLLAVAAAPLILLVLYHGRIPPLSSYDEPYEVSMARTLYESRALFVTLTPNKTVEFNLFTGFSLVRPLAGLWMSLVGAGFTQARIFYLLIGAVSLPFVYATAGRLYGRVASLIAVVVLAIWLLHHNYARPDMFVTTTLAIGLYFYFKWRDETTSYKHIVIGVVLALGIEGHTAFGMRFAGALGLVYLWDALRSMREASNIDKPVEQKGVTNRVQTPTPTLPCVDTAVHPLPVHREGTSTPTVSNAAPPLRKRRGGRGVRLILGHIFIDRRVLYYAIGVVLVLLMFIVTRTLLLASGASESNIFTAMRDLFRSRNDGAAFFDLAQRFEVNSGLYTQYIRFHALEVLLIIITLSIAFIRRRPTDTLLAALYSIGLIYMLLTLVHYNRDVGNYYAIHGAPLLALLIGGLVQQLDAKLFANDDTPSSSGILTWGAFVVLFAIIAVLTADTLDFVNRRAQDSQARLLEVGEQIAALVPRDVAIAGTPVYYLAMADRPNYVSNTILLHVSVDEWAHGSARLNDWARYGVQSPGAILATAGLDDTMPQAVEFIERNQFVRVYCPPIPLFGRRAILYMSPEYLPPDGASGCAE
ncbi:MAG: hypothetical protein D6737_17720 [Chloroflexi bacterium]|nr:MAG: hypothetical protein D6737_17720 [Chloroflexota bacterium]